jgi:2-polyprenyl-3-methyl-5-hydroxy-6-metoxy-1,4-benzoquinol methylase
LFDTVYCDYVLEHVERPEGFLLEVFRVLKPGGAFFFRTPNLWHYVSLAARLLPHGVHARVANKARGLGAGAHEPYPTWHRMNTRRTLRGLCAEAGFRELDMVLFEGEPSYLMFSSLSFLAGVAYERAVNASPRFARLRANIMGRAVK